MIRTAMDGPLGPHITLNDREYYIIGRRSWTLSFVSAGGMRLSLLPWQRTTCQQINHICKFGGHPSPLLGFITMEFRLDMRVRSVLTGFGRNMVLRCQCRPCKHWSHHSISCTSSSQV